MTSAAKARAYINAAFNFGLKGAHDYTLPDATTNWGLTSNPVLAIKTDASARRFGQRFLSPGEFKILWDWCKENNGYSMFTRTVWRCWHIKGDARPAPEPRYERRVEPALR